MKKVFIDGSEGTTGLRIGDRLKLRDDIEFIKLGETERKNPEARREALNSADYAFLCLPDPAADEDAAMTVNPDTVLIDASTAHRTQTGWSYGFPELSPAHRRAIKTSKRISVPGCYASGFISLVYPLVSAGILKPESLLCCHAVSGYSGSGKKMILDYQSKNRSELLAAPRQYALGAQHKHLKEMQAVCGLDTTPILCPIVSDYYSGMVVTVPLFKESLSGAESSDIAEIYSKLYNTAVVHYSESLGKPEQYRVTLCQAETI